jgi:uncharacterized protein YegP (UPF0339 family)
MSKTEVFRGQDGQWYFHVTGDNGEIVAQSEAYTRKADAEEGVRTLRRVVADLDQEEEVLDEPSRSNGTR